MNGFDYFKNIKLRFGRSPRVGLFAVSFVPQATQKDVASIPNASVVQTKTISAKRNLYKSKRLLFVCFEFRCS